MAHKQSIKKVNGIFFYNSFSTNGWKPIPGAKTKEDIENYFINGKDKINRFSDPVQYKRPELEMFTADNKPCTYFEVTRIEGKQYIAVNLSGKDPDIQINPDENFTDKQLKTYLQELSLKHYGKVAEIEFIEK
mgnify:CR=1 FL=1